MSPFQRRFRYIQIVIIMNFVAVSCIGIKRDCITKKVNIWYLKENDVLNLLSRFLCNSAGNSDFSKKWSKLECVSKYSD